MFESMQRRTEAVKARLVLSLGACENQVLGFGQLMNNLIAQNASGSDVDLFLENTLSMASLYTVHLGCGTSLGFAGNDGVLAMNYEQRMALYQRGWPPASSTLYFLDFDFATFQVKSVLNSLPGFIIKNAQLAPEILEALPDTSHAFWTGFTLPNSYKEIVTFLITGIVEPDDPETLRGTVTSLLTPSIFRSLFADLVSEEIKCIFLQDLAGCLIASTCENATVNITGTLERVCLVNSSVSVVQESWIEQQKVEIYDNISLVHKSSSSFAFIRLETEQGFKAICTVIAGNAFINIFTRINFIVDTQFFTATYDSVTLRAKITVQAGVICASLLACAIAAVTLLGQVEVIRRIKTIVDSSLGEPTSRGTTNVVHPEQDVDVESGTNKKKEVCGFSKIFGKLSEIDIILKKLNWLEGKVKIVTAFVPVVAKLVCKRGVSDESILDSCLARRLGCYMFIDIAGQYNCSFQTLTPAGFTPLCEGVSPDAAAKVLELFYNVVETAASVKEHNLLVKRLGDGVFITWGFKLAVCLHLFFFRLIMKKRWNNKIARRNSQFWLIMQH